VIADHTAILPGYHAAGVVGNPRGARLLNCTTVGHLASVAVGNSATLQPYVFYSGTNAPNADCLGHDLFFSAVPLLDTLGAPITGIDNACAPMLGYSHTDGGGDVLTGVEWSTWCQCDFMDQLKAKHSVSFASTGIPILAGNVGTYARTDAGAWPVVARDGLVVGDRALSPRNGVDSIDCHYDREGFGDPAADANVMSTLAGGPYLIRAKGGSIKFGASRNYFGSVENGTYVDFTDVDIDTDDAGSIFSTATATSGLTLGGCAVKAKTSRLRVLDTSTGVFDAGVASAPFVSRGGNIFDEQVKIGQSRQTWTSAADRTLATLLTQKDPALRDTQGAKFRHETFGANLISNGDFASDIAGWDDPSGTTWVWSAEEGGSLQMNLSGSDRPIYSPSIAATAGDIVEISFQVYSAFLVGNFRFDIVNSSLAVPTPTAKANVRATVTAGGIYTERVLWRTGYDKLRITRTAGGNQRGRFDNFSARVVTVVS
jgi:hypothetical protein